MGFPKTKKWGDTKFLCTFIIIFSKMAKSISIFEVDSLLLWRCKTSDDAKHKVR